MLGCPFLEGSEDPSLASGGLMLPTLTMVIMSVATSFPSVILGQPQLGGTLGLPPNKVVPSWAIKAAWKPMPQKSHSPLGKEKDFLQDLKILEIHPYLLQYLCESKFLGTTFG
jgi:hypothetical protein